MNAADLAKILKFYARFTPNYSRVGHLARRLTWSGDSTLNFSGQRWLVTGASGGIGEAIATAAAEAGAEVVAVARSERKLQAITRDLTPEAVERLTLSLCDLSSSRSIATLLGSLQASGHPFDVLVNNVGLLLNSLQLTDEGRETSFATNLLGHFQLTEGLLDAGLLVDGGIVINMSSGGLYNAPLGIKLLNNTDPATYGGKVAYAFAKRAQVSLSAYWDERLQKTGGHSYVMHPGWVRTPGVREALPIFWKIQGAILRTPAEGADTALWLAATRPDDAGDTIWFDRKARPQHVFEHTQTPQCTAQELVAYLQSELADMGAEPDVA